MPQAVGFLTPYVAGFLGSIGVSTGIVVAASGAIASALVYGGLAAASYLAQSAFSTPLGQQNSNAPKPEDGKYNLKQSVPTLTYVLGKTKKAGDYAFLEETGGKAYHIMVWAAHSIHGFSAHYLHDEAVTLDGSGNVTAPGHFDSKVRIETRLGADASTVYATVASAFPTIWDADHRGDGLASVMMRVGSVPIEDQQKVFPNGMPQHSAVGEGHDRIHDPRTETYGYTTNIALFRLWHLTHPVGGKLTLEDMYLPDWKTAADVCDQTVTDRDGNSLDRYHGGFWFRANNSPVDVGRIMDQAGELVLYERPDGTIGVHAGAYAEPDVRLTANDLVSVSYDPNKRRATNVLAVRGRYTEPDKGYNTTDAAIYGVPYPSDDERTKTVENQAVQAHNHMARLQKLAYLRANAPRVKLTAHYDAAKLTPYRRWIKVHYPPKMTEAIVEITGRPTLSLRNLSYTFDGIVLAGDPYAFNAAAEEGAPGANVTIVDRNAVPTPADFAVTIKQETIAGGATAAYAEASFSFQNATFLYEIEYAPTAGGAAISASGQSGETTVRTNALADGVEYKFRARTWSGGTSTDWTAYQTLTATANPTAPAAVTGVTADTASAGQVTIGWDAPNDTNYYGARVFTNTVDDFGTASQDGAPEYGPSGVADSRTVSLAANTYYGWVQPINSSGVAGTAAATGSFIVS